MPIKYRIILANGHVHTGTDERFSDELLECVDVPDQEMPDGWTWLAGLYVRSKDVIAVETVKEVSQ